MTLKNSFSNRRVENYKRRIGIVIITVLLQVFYYLGYLIMYYSRIRSRYKAGWYKTEAIYKGQMYQATHDALTFNEISVFVITGLAILIAVQGFSYLYSRKKIDLYHSVPVDAKERFWTIYTNGILLYFGSLLLTMVLCLLTALTQGAINGHIMGQIAISFLFNAAYFMAVYHLAILAVMLCGNILISGAMLLGFLYYPGYLVMAIDSLMSHFFKTRCYDFTTDLTVIFSLPSYFMNTCYKNRYTYSTSKIWNGVWLGILEMIIIAGITLALTIFAYQKRASEMAGKAIAFPKIRPIIKFLVATYAGLAAANVIYQLSENNKTLAWIALVLGAGMVGFAIEAVFELDVKALFKKPLVTVGSIIAAAVIMAIFQFDLVGYDHYIPKEDQIESYAICINSLAGYDSFFEESNQWGSDYENTDFQYIASSDYAKNHMFLKDSDAVCKLAATAITYMDRKEDEQAKNPDSMVDDNYGQYFSVLYRLKSGRVVKRSMMMDPSDLATRELLNRIIADEDFAKGAWQLVEDADIVNQHAKEFSYYNGIIRKILPMEDYDKLLKLWMDDFKQYYNYDLVYENVQCGTLEIKLGEYWRLNLPVYSNFERVNAYAKQKEPLLFKPIPTDQIESIQIYNYHNELYEDEEIARGYDYNLTRSVSYYAKETYQGESQFEDILNAIVPMEFNLQSLKPNMIDTNYNVTITLKPDSTYPVDGYNRYEISNLCMYSDLIPSYVEEDTALEGYEE